MKNLIFVRLIDALFRSLITNQQSDFSLIVLEVRPRDATKSEKVWSSLDKYGRREGAVKLHAFMRKKVAIVKIVMLKALLCGFVRIAILISSGSI